MYHQNPLVQCNTFAFMFYKIIKLISDELLTKNNNKRDADSRLFNVSSEAGAHLAKRFHVVDLILPHKSIGQSLSLSVPCLDESEVMYPSPTAGVSVTELKSSLCWGRPNYYCSPRPLPIQLPWSMGTVDVPSTVIRDEKRLCSWSTWPVFAVKGLCSNIFVEQRSAGHRRNIICYAECVELKALALLTVRSFQRYYCI